MSNNRLKPVEGQKPRRTVVRNLDFSIFKAVVRRSVWCPVQGVQGRFQCRITYCKRSRVAVVGWDFPSLLSVLSVELGRASLSQGTRGGTTLRVGPVF